MHHQPACRQHPVCMQAGYSMYGGRALAVEHQLLAAQAQLLLSTPLCALSPTTSPYMPPQDRPPTCRHLLSTPPCSIPPHLHTCRLKLSPYILLPLCTFWWFSDGLKQALTSITQALTSILGGGLQAGARRRTAFFCFNRYCLIASLRSGVGMR